ncbi:MAG TPA: IPT/TIG domain-containing protein [Capillimicrobium sp.]|jgi:hypothetical protein
MRLTKLAAAAAALSLSLTGAATAGAAVYTIGPTNLGPDALTPGVVQNYGTDDETFINRDLPLGSVPSIGSPGDIVTWRINAGTTGPVRLVVLHPTGVPGEYAVTAADDQVAGQLGVNTFTPSTPIPIAAGDTIGIVQLPGGALPRYGDDPSTATWVKSGALAPMSPTTGQTFTAPVAPAVVTLYNADVDDAVAPPTPPTPPTPPAPKAPVVETPVVGTVSQAVGTTAGGADLVITGANFTADSRVFFGDVEATSVTVDRFDRLSVVVPPQGPGTVEVRVLNAAGVGAVVGVYTYAGEPAAAPAAPVAAPPVAVAPEKPKKAKKGKGKTKKAAKAKR